MSRRANGRRNRRNNKNFAGALLLGFSAILVVGGGVAYYQSVKHHTAIDGETYCPETGPNGVVVIVVDRTDPFNAIQTAALQAEFRFLSKSLNKHERLDLYTISSDNEVILRPDFSLCNPGEGTDLNPLIANPELAARRWRNAFEQPLSNALNSAMEKGTANQSPILESIQSISITAFRDRALVDKPKRLIVVSDMLQHSKIYSHYTQTPNFASFTKTDRYRQVRTDLKGVDVELLYVRRSTPRQIQGRDHVEFWQKFFHAQGARLERVSAIEG